ncbi:hypothetical protein I4U23_010852 [Adineta vaga]|nr:hypothetical protein I4U23_010852 [Adineta vaga]
MSDNLQSNQQVSIEQGMEHSNGEDAAQSCAVTLPIRISERRQKYGIRPDEYSIIEDPKDWNSDEAKNEVSSDDSNDDDVEDNDELSSLSSTSSSSSSSAYWEEFIRELKEKYPTEQQLVRGIMDDYCGHPLEILQQQLFLSSILPKPSDENALSFQQRIYSEFWKSNNTTTTMTTFSSTSLDPNIALNFASSADGLISCRFEIIITDSYNNEKKIMVRHEQVFANITSLSAMPDEQEVLFSLVTHFRREHIEYGKNRSDRPWVLIILELVTGAQRNRRFSDYDIINQIGMVEDSQIYTDILNMKSNSTIRTGQYGGII